MRRRKTDTKKALGIWQEVFEVKDVRVDDNFFEFGGDSLLALTLMILIERVMGARLRATSLPRAPTICQFAGLLGAKSSLPVFRRALQLGWRQAISPRFLLRSQQNS